MLIEEVEGMVAGGQIQALSLNTVLSHLRDSFEIDFCEPRLVAQAL